MQINRSHLTDTESRSLRRPEDALAEEARRFEAQWQAFPTVIRDRSGVRHYWVVPADTGRTNEDWAVGEKLARQTVDHMRRFPEGACVLRHVLREIDGESQVAQGFLATIEDILTYPERYTGSQADWDVPAGFDED